MNSSLIYLIAITIIEIIIASEFKFKSKPRTKIGIANHSKKSKFTFKSVFIKKVYEKVENKGEKSNFYFRVLLLKYFYSDKRIKSDEKRDFFVSAFYYIQTLFSMLFWIFSVEITGKNCRCEWEKKVFRKICVWR